MVVADERQRHEIYTEFEGWLGPEKAEALMGMLPTSDVATKADLERHDEATKADLQRVEDGVRADLQRVEDGVRADLQRVEDGLRADLQRHEEVTKAEFALVREELAGHKDATRAEFAMVRKDIGQLDMKIDGVRTELTLKIEALGDKLRAELGSSMRTYAVSLFFSLMGVIASMTLILLTTR